MPLSQSVGLGLPPVVMSMTFSTLHQVWDVLCRERDNHEEEQL
jgi:hypothetical protein